MKTKLLILISLFFIVLSAENIPAKRGVLWNFKTGGKIYSTPLVAGENVYFGSLDGKFYSVDKLTGKKNWEFDTGNPIYSNAIFSDGFLIFESGYELYFLSEKGEVERKIQLSKYPILNQIDAWDFFHSSPVVSDGKVFIGSPFGGVLGFDIKTGEQILKVQTKQGGIVRTTPIVKNDKIYFGDWDGIFYSYEISSGKELWKYDTRKDTTFIWTNAVQEKPILVNDKIYFAGRSCAIYCLNANTGEKIWNYFSKNSGWLVGGPVYSDGFVYLGSSNEFILQKFEAEKGNLIWEKKLDHRIWGNVLIDNDDLIIGAGSLYQIEKENGEVKNVLIDKKNLKIEPTKTIWRQYDGKAVLASFHSSPVKSEDVVYIGCDDGNLYAVKLK